MCVCVCVHARARMCVCVTVKNAGIEKEEEEEGVMSKVRKTERRECREFGSIVQECFPFAT